jgi:hypothetical protein
MHDKPKEEKLICVLCGAEWIGYKNRCECGGFCTWGYSPNKPESFTIDENGNWHLKSPPNDSQCN